MDRAFCHQVPACPFTRNDESVRMRQRTDQRLIINRNVKNNSPEIGWANSQTAQRPIMGLSDRADPLDSKEYPSEDNKRRAGFFGHGCGLFSGCRHRHPAG
jgi:hypothetical protein